MKDGKSVSPVKGEPAYESFYPYLPLMTVFGLPSGVQRAPLRLTDARIMFSGVTLLVVLRRIGDPRAPSERKVRTLQVLTVLPDSGAACSRPAATTCPSSPSSCSRWRSPSGGDPGWSGIVLGIVSAMKFTAWPLAALALFAARDASGKRAPGRMALGLFAVAGPVVAPFLIVNPHVVHRERDPLPTRPLGGGFARRQPAARPPAGQPRSRACTTCCPIVALALGGAVLLRRLIRRPPATPADVCRLGGWVMLIAILVAPATRIGYLVYPINFFVWAFMFRGADRDAELERSLHEHTAVLA